MGLEGSRGNELTSRGRRTLNMPVSCDIFTRSILIQREKICIAMSASYDAEINARENE